MERHPPAAHSALPKVPFVFTSHPVSRLTHRFEDRGPAIEMPMSRGRIVGVPQQLSNGGGRRWPEVTTGAGVKIYLGMCAQRASTGVKRLFVYASLPIA